MGLRRVWRRLLILDCCRRPRLGGLHPGFYAALITTYVEAERIRDEYDPAAHGFDELVSVPWQDPEAFVRAAERLAGAPAARLASDGHPAFGLDASADLVALRLALSEAERDDLADLGHDAAAALQSALISWQPGERDLDIQARCAAHLEAAGADAPVLIVGGDDRLERYRHPMAVGAPVSRLVMAVVVARRGGLHVAATRFATAYPLDDAHAALRRKVLAIDDAVLSACRPGATYGVALAALDAAYAQAGAPGEWAGHYQGGPIGFAQREFEIAPDQAASRWAREPISEGHAIAWNPSLPGGAKVEDTYLVDGDGFYWKRSDRGAGLAGPNLTMATAAAAPRCTGGRHVSDGSQAQGLDRCAACWPRAA